MYFRMLMAGHFENCPASGRSPGTVRACPLQWWRIARKERRANVTRSVSRIAAAFTLLAKFAHLAGMVLSAWHLILRRERQVIECKPVRHT
jgi:hypothetical protein